MGNPMIKRLTDSYLNGRDLGKLLTLSLLSEAVIDAADINKFIKSSTFKHIDKIAKEIFKYAEIDVAWEEYTGMTNREGVELAIEYMFYVRNFLQSLHIQNFPDSVKRQIDASVRTLKTSEGTADKKLKEAEAAENGEKVLQGLPKTYFRRAIDALSAVFGAMSIPWEYDYNWENYLKKSGEGSKDTSTWDSDGRRVVDYGVPEEVVSLYRNQILAAQKDDNLENLRKVIENKELFDILCGEMGY